ncbi:MAG TPA: RtcB family protein [Clostridia bacterium]|nr:RtcB family protein [Clostridia bacterium]
MSTQDEKGEKWQGPLERIDDYRWRIPRGYKPQMKVPGIIYADPDLLSSIRADKAPEQVANVACMPGIVGASLAMPDIHWGYGFPIGGVAAMAVDDGVIAPGGIGYDINCGVRILLTSLSEDEAKPRLERLMDRLFEEIPLGVGSEGDLRLNPDDWRGVMTRGAEWAVERGFGLWEDLEACEEGGAMRGADPDQVSSKARKRGAGQLGTLGSGNHFIEVSVVENVFNEAAASEFGLFSGQVVAQIHSGSRGFGHQICTDYVEVMADALEKYDIWVPDKQLACAPINSPEGKSYFAAMVCAANYAWANRQILAHHVVSAFEKVFESSRAGLGIKTLYDVAHNIAKIETHEVNGKPVKLCVHRKGATRAFGPGRPEIPERYRKVGQPVLVPGDMGRNSYVLLGTERAMEETFGSSCHGAGRLMSRRAAKKGLTGKTLREELRRRGILVLAKSDASLVEEAPDVYKDVNEVVGVTHSAGISTLVARLRPLGVIKG